MNTNSPVLTRPNREQSTPYEILVAIAPDIANIQQLASGLRPGVRLLLLNARDEPISQIGNYLEQFQHPVSLHLITHGAPGCLKFGATRLNADNWANWAQDLQTWRGRVGEILLYGCEVGAARGKQFVKNLAAITGAKIAASETATGSAALGGNWNLEYATGEIQQSLAFRPEVLAAYDGIFFDRTVNTVTELIQAINDANATAGTNTIRLVAGTTYTLTNRFLTPGRADFQVFAANNGGIGRGFVGLPKITGDITIEGNGATIERSSTAPDFRLFYVDGEDGFQGKLTLNNIALKGGRATEGTVPGVTDQGNDGGAIWNAGRVTINQGTISNNFAADDGGAIANYGTLTINDSTLTGNKAQGAVNPPGVTDNGSGGAIDNRTANGGPGELYLNNTTITGNDAKTVGGGVSNAGSVFIRQNSPITGNTSANFADIGGTQQGSNIIIRDGANVIADNTPTEVDLGAIDAGQTRTLVIANNGTYQLVLREIQLPTGVSLGSPAPTVIAAPTAPAPETTQNLVLGGPLQDAGVFSGSLAIKSNDGDNKENPYNFTFKLTVNGPEINVLDPNNNNVPTGTGNFNFGNVPPGTTFPFTIKNTGTQALNLSNLQLPNGLILAGNFPTTIAPGTSGILPLRLDPNFRGALNGTIRFNSNDNNEGNYEFAIAGTVNVPPTPVPPTPIPTVDTLTNVGDNVFVIGRNGGAGLEFQVLAREALFVSEMGVFRVGANNEILDFNGNSTGIAPGNPNYERTALTNGNTIFSSINNFNYSNKAVTRVLPGLSDGSSTSLSKFNAGDRLVFYFISNGSTDANLAGRAPSGTPFLGSTFGQQRFEQLRARETAPGQFVLSWEDRRGGGDADFNDLQVALRQTTRTAPAGATLQGSPEGEVLDLRAFNGAKTVRFTVLENEAAFKNQVGLYRVDVEGQILNPTTGAATGVRVGAGNYKDVALANRVEGLNLTSGAVDFQLQGGDNGLYAPFIIANGDTNNVFFPFMGANSDGVDHVRLLGDNTFGFEDFVGGLDFDYNDFTFQAAIA